MFFFIFLLVCVFKPVKLDPGVKKMRKEVFPEDLIKLQILLSLQVSILRHTTGHDFYTQ